MSEIQSSYRPEIDGLRAVAVVPVVLFHAGFQIFSGGFVGVDVFFVISGYLITGILLSDIDAGRYSIAQFYERRARRILPALFLVLAASIPFAYIAMLPEELARFGKSILAVLGFVSNITFWLEEGYFTDASELKPLLHTWSLAVEEQFYIAFPLVLLLMRKASRKAITVLIGFAALISFGLCEFASQKYHLANFYLAPTRAWELLAGSLCACLGRQESRYGGILAILGLALILAAIFALDGTFAFPSRWALLPVVGTVLLILYAEPGRGAGRLLAWKPFIGIGLISYSLYLWHQPLFAFARLLAPGPLPRGTMLTLALLAGALAWASWKWVEQPFRRRDGMDAARKALPLALASALLLGGLGGWLFASGGVPTRFSLSYDPAVQAMTRADPPPRAVGGDCQPDGDGFAPPCLLQGLTDSSESFALYGDSHAQALLPAFRAVAERRHARLYYGSLGGCPPLLGAYVLAGNSAPESCSALAEAQLAQAKRERPDRVYLVGRWALYTADDPLNAPGRYLLADSPHPWRWTRADSRRTFPKLLARTVDAYRKAGLKVTIVDQLPTQRFRLDRGLARLAYRPSSQGLEAEISATSISEAEFAALRAASEVALKEQEARGVAVLRLEGALRSGDRYLWGKPGEAWYRDANHISTTGALRLVPQILASVEVAAP